MSKGSHYSSSSDKSFLVFFFLAVCLSLILFHLESLTQEEEEERSDRWNSFLEDHGSSEEKYLPPGPDLTRGDEKKVLRSQSTCSRGCSYGSEG